MALRRGFTRLWIVLSVLWLFVWLLGNQTLQNAWGFAARSYLSTSVKPNDLELISFDSGLATIGYHDVRNAWVDDEEFWMDGPRVLEIDTSGITPSSGEQWTKLLEAAALKFNQDAAQVNAKIRLVRDKVLADLVVAVAIPLSLFALGMLTAWVATGFRERS